MTYQNGRRHIICRMRDDFTRSRFYYPQDLIKDLPAGRLLARTLIVSIDHTNWSNGEEINQPSSLDRPLARCMVMIRRPLDDVVIPESLRSPSLGARARRVRYKLCDSLHLYDEILRGWYLLHFARLLREARVRH